MTKKKDPLDWWRKARFGLFIHWGLYAVPAGTWKGKRIPGIGEWIMSRAQIPVREYEQLAKKFNPVKFNAREWVKLANDAGQKYLVITSKHHDGFAMFKSPCSPYNIVDATPYRKDPMAALARECRKAGIRLCFYYSQAQDWHDPDAAGNRWDWPDDGTKDFEAYLKRKCIPQVTELLTRYGPIGLIWFDTPQRITRPQSLRLKRLVHRRQPNCLVSGRVGHNVGDYGSLGDNQHPVGPLKGDWETPCTLNDTWGYKTYDKNWKSVDHLITLLVNCASKGVNYLLNVGPTKEGVIPKPSADRLRAIGAWLKVNGEAIYGTQASPFPCDVGWGRMTCKRGTVYLHVLNWPRGKVSIVGLRNRVTGARVLADRRATVGVDQTHDTKGDEHIVTLTLPRKKPDRYASVIALDIAGAPDVDRLPVQQVDGSVSLPAYMAKIRAAKTSGTSIGRSGAVEGWRKTTVALDWTCKIRHPGVYRVIVESAVDRHRKELFGDHRVKVAVGRQRAVGTAGRKDMIMDEAVNRWHVAQSDIGTVTIRKPGRVTVTLKATQLDTKAGAGFTASGVRLVKA